MRKFFFLAALCCAMMANAAQFDGLKTITSGGVERQYYLYVPNTLKANSPMLISCHGPNQDYLYQKEQTRWPSVADTAQFVVVYPVGTAVTVWGSSFASGWNISDMTDVNFMLDIVREVHADYAIDTTRVYMSGFSEGATFVYYVARKAADKFAAFAPVSGYDLMDNTTTTSRPVPIIHIHGKNDNVINYSGVKSYVNKWALAQGCLPTPIETTEDNCEVTRYTGGRCAVDVVLYSVNGRGHVPDDNNCPTQMLIWLFCKEFSTGCGRLDPEGIDNVDSGKSKVDSRKKIENGVLLIERGGKTYNAQGAEVR